MRIATIDFETRSPSPILKDGGWLYSRHPKTEILCLGYLLPGESEIKLWHCAYPALGISASDAPEDLFQYIQDGGLLEAHNSFFERAIWENVASPQLAWPPIPPDSWRCSAARAAAVGLPRALEAAMIALGVSDKYLKSHTGHQLMKRLTSPNPKTGAYIETREEIEALWEYCIQDVRAEAKLAELIPELNAKELQVWKVDQEINHTGILFDPPFIRAAIRHDQAWTQILNARLERITGVPRGTMTARLRAWLEAEEGVKTDSLSKQAIARLRRGSLSERAEEVLSLRLEASRASTRKYPKMLSRLDVDNRARDELRIYGALTGRWTGSGIQVQNLLRNDSKYDFDGICSDLLEVQDTEQLAKKYGDLSGAISNVLRGAIIPRPGHKLLCMDYSAIEARTLFYLAGDQEALKVCAEGDLYSDLASAIYGFRVNKKDHPEARFTGKCAVLGLGYRMGAPKFLLELKRQGVDLSLSAIKKVLRPDDRYEFGAKAKERLNPTRKEVETTSEFRKRVRAAMRDKEALTAAGIGAKEQIAQLAFSLFVVSRFRQKYPKVVAYWDGLEEAAHEALKTGSPQRFGVVRWESHKLAGLDSLVCVLPSGRFLWYPQASIVDYETMWGEVRPTIQFHMHIQSQGGWADTHTWGSKLTENLCQAISRDFLAEALLRLSKEKIMMTVHDEIVLEIPENTEKDGIQKLVSTMSRTPEWAKGFPLAAECSILSRYRK